MLAFIAVALACGALLCAPVWAVIALKTALPIGSIVTGSVLCLPYPLAFSATQYRFFGWPHANNNLAANQAWGFGCAGEFALGAKRISAFEVAKMMGRARGECWIALQLLTARGAWYSYGMVVVVLALITTKGVPAFRNDVRSAVHHRSACIARYLWHKNTLSGVLVACLELTMHRKGLCVVYHIPAQRQAPDIRNYNTCVAFDQTFNAVGGSKWLR